LGRLRDLHDAGVAIWLDTLSRELLDTGAFARLIADLGRITAELEGDGVQAFCASYRQLLDRIRSKLPHPGERTADLHATSRR
jgi:hypothetical protein